MKIGILSYHSVPNFGANCQIYSTVGFLKNNGYDPIIINWIPKLLEERYKLSTPMVQIEAHNHFVNNHIPCTEICRSDIDIVKEITKNNLKGIIIGSDVVLQHALFLSRIHLTKRGFIIDKIPSSDKLFPNPFWGSFIKHLENEIPVVMMSVSSQNTLYTKINGTTRKRMRDALKKFKIVTVRDNWTKKMVEYLTFREINPVITPDPVFAYNQNIIKQYSKEQILEKFKLPNKYLLFSFRTENCVTESWLGAFKKLAERNNYSCVALPTKNGVNFSHPFQLKIEIPLSPDEWYALIKHSSGYIGENMHPIVVALHNNVPFYSFDSYGILKMKFFVTLESSKTYDILSRAGFLQNYVNILGKGYKCPSPAEVYLRITDFNYLKSVNYSTEMLVSYNSMMRKITSFFES